MPARKITKDKVAYYIENVHETTERIDIKSQKKLSKESRVPKYIIEGLAKTGFLYKKQSGIYACRLNTPQTSNRFYLDLAEKVLFTHYKPDFNKVVFENYRWEHVTSPFNTFSQEQVEKAKAYADQVERKIFSPEERKELSFWSKIKRFFGL